MTCDKQCPFCKELVQYWPNCSENTSKDYHNYGWLYQGKGKWKIKKYFHLSCLKENSRKSSG